MQLKPATRAPKIVALLFVLSSVLTLSLHAQSFSGVLTWHNDNGRTGQNLSETILTPQNVNAATFGKVLSYPVDGMIYAQPLYVPNVTIPNQGTHNVVYVATQNDSVYAFDADGQSANPIWHVSFINPSNGIQPVNCVTAQLSCNAYPIDGVTGTPVIDPTINTMYVVSHTYENGSYYMKLHALDITTGAEEFGGPIAMQAQVDGTGTGSKGGKITMNTKNDIARPALLLLKGVGTNGILYVTQGGYPHSWVLAYDPITLTQLGVFMATPNGTLGGIWQSGAGPAADNNNNIYLATGDGTFDASTGGTDYGDTVVKLNSFLSVIDYFTPMDQACRFTSDFDLASGGPMVLPPQPGPVANELLMAGKGGSPCDASGFAPIYLLNAATLGGYNPTQDNVVQEISGSPIGYWSSPAYFQGDTGTWVYYGGVTKDHATGDNLKAYSLTNGQLSTTPTSQSSNVLLNGGTPSVSANGTTNGIVWLLSRQDYLDTRPGVMPAVLYAYDATNLATQLYSSAQSTQYGKRDQAGCGTKFQVPTVANGKVFVGTESELDIYGLINQPLAAYPVILSAPCANLGSVDIGTTSKAQQITVKNNGPGNLTFNSVTIVGTNATEFAQTTTCAGSLGPGRSCTITVTFTPANTGPRFASITISDSAITPQTVYLIGNGASSVTLTPASLNFGTVTVGSSSQPKPATLKNTGTSTVTVNSILVSGIDNKDFTQRNNCTSTLLAGQSCTINVKFTPIAIGNRNATLNVNSSAGPTLKVTLSGTGQ